MLFTTLFYFFRQYKSIALREEIYGIDDIEKCSVLTGKYVIRLRIAAEEQVLISLSQLNNAPNISPGQLIINAQAYFGSIVRDLNIFLRPFGVEIRPDFGQLLLENFQDGYEFAECRRQGTIMKKVKSMINMFKERIFMQNTFRLFVFFCPYFDPKTKFWSYGEDFGACGKILGVLYHHPMRMREVIIDNILKAIGGGINSEDIDLDTFNRGLCDFTRSCFSITGNSMGSYMPGEQNVLHAATYHNYIPYESMVRFWPYIYP
ncbi:hypothetical protein EDEG_02975 [Edhazardia aedis USNM 41457]|uniref:Uncharacterized protein n=1 Tax=Edhazardia aedis (strain USNM 41457) TaxID=1003232 RepID=J9DMQ8_EDHAE|nr:hypothetical protein EDEG_02975 [Edhazardia aedis USNM 41457]|eukprot:EJW02617.1 hypothetical protein EDEG_02975 [Edhazardia aedis USNM 41457]